MKEKLTTKIFLITLKMILDMLKMDGYNGRVIQYLEEILEDYG